MRTTYFFVIVILLASTIGVGIILINLHPQNHSTNETSQELVITSNTNRKMGHEHQNWTESAFIEHMIPHHEEAISQSKMMLTKTVNSKYQAILENIIEVQTAEVAQMKQWYQDWNNEPYQDQGVYEPMMSQIYSYSGKILEREWLQSMVYHHQAAIYMSQSGLKTIHKEELRGLMERIKISQGAQIFEMEDLINEIRGA
jgi:uncharacterized protein (DUF305 family)